MNTGSYPDGRAPVQPCWFCHHFEGWTFRGSLALCSAPLASRVRATPEAGCASWTREPGADDVPDWLPPGIDPDPGATYVQAARRIAEARRTGIPTPADRPIPRMLFEPWLNR